ncbi:hypothetical protein BKA70DRAFT_305852 [Coprinopsis sp. MPI-PUGE-AT-0042]|nr:hypothetical protein BKA70DRAFT_305852 [Coprinopsis sp. MPI-PUGE-AT-0042]
MGRWTQYDEDDYRLPEGMKRIGYDADAGRYYFKDADGSVWQSAEGSEYGELTKVSNSPSSLVLEDNDNNDDLEGSPRSAQYPNRASSAYRPLFPFFLIIAVFLLLVWRLILEPNIVTGNPRCPEGTAIYYIQPGDSCWDVARGHGIGLDRFKELNPKVQCEPLAPGVSVCVPPLDSSLSAFRRAGKI